MMNQKCLLLLAYDKFHTLNNNSACTVTSPSHTAMLALQIYVSLEASKYRNFRADLAKYREMLGKGKI